MITIDGKAAMSRKIIVLGGDGFCGWPTSLHLSRRGYDVTIVDNLSRRDIDNELECCSLTPISTIEERLEAWQCVSNQEVGFQHVDIARDYDSLLGLIRRVEPMAIVHFAEQRAAPYSMKSSFHKRYTVDNNINATHNLMAAVVESDLDIHVVHLGTMGVYGYGTAGLEIPEGYMPVKVSVDGKDKEIDIPYPANPGSIYHMTKCIDAIVFSYYNKNDDVKVTDLHQGIVWGTYTDETMLAPELVNRFDYDGDYGTVLNRFLMQAAIGHPLTVHGTGGQTRAFIHIRDTVKCIELAIANPPESVGRVRIFNQATETHTIRTLAKQVSEMTGVEIANVPNPRNEAAENSLRLSNRSLLDLGLNPTTLSGGLMNEVVDVARKFSDRVDVTKIPALSKWRSDTSLEDPIMRGQ